VRTRIVGVLDTKLFSKNFVAFLHEIFNWSFAFFLFYFLIIVPE
jgi:hypothetical protein